MPNIRLSGSELYCLAQAGLGAGELVFGNCVYSIGAIRSLNANMKAAVGHELQQASQIAAEGRETAYQRMSRQVLVDGQHSVCAIQSKIIAYPNCLEFLTTGSLIHVLDKTHQQPIFSSAANGQELYIQLDAGYQPRGFVFGNVVYASGLTQGLWNNLKSFSQGEVKDLSATFNYTRNQALERIIKQAKTAHANALLGIQTRIVAFGEACEMSLTGSACYHPQFSKGTQDELVSSGLSAVDLWSFAKLGYAPMRFLLETSVYSVGMAGSLASTMKAFLGGEVNSLTKMMHEARMKTLASLNQQAEILGADEVMGVKTYVYSLGNGLLEFFVMGTAMKKLTGMNTQSEQLVSQAFQAGADIFYNDIGDLKKGSALTGALQLLVLLLLVVFFIWLSFKK